MTVTPACGVPPPRFGQIGDQCGTTTIHEVGAQYTGPAYTGMPGACASFATGDDLYQLGPSVSLATGVVTIDP